MAKQNGITQKARRFQNSDQAVAAQRLVTAAGEDDEAYDRAIEKLENASATTPAGVKAIFDLYRMRAESEMVCYCDPQYVALMDKLARNISSALDHLVRKAG